jgi:hypothetical protein
MADKKKKLKVVLLLFILAGAVVTVYFLCKSQEGYNGGGRLSPGKKNDGVKPKPPSHPDRCCGNQQNMGVPIWDTCGHICGMSKHRGTDLGCLGGNELTMWATAGQKPHGWKHPNQHPDHETCCGEVNDVVPVWDTCGHICSLNHKGKMNMDPNGVTLWGNTGSGHSGGYTGSSTEAVCHSGSRYMP